MEKTGIIDQIKIKIDEREVLRYLGYQRNVSDTINHDMKKIVQQGIAGAYPLLENKGIYQFLPVSSISDEGIILADRNDCFLINKKVIHLLKNIEMLVLAVVTIGPRIEDVVHKKFKEHQYLEAMVLDAAGTVAVKTVGRWLNHLIEQKSTRERLQLSRYFEPGSGDWDIREQKKVFSILQPERIGVKLNSSNMMQPAKSLSWIRGLGHELIDSYRDEFSCQYCLLENCPFRKKDVTSRALKRTKAV